MDFYRCENPDCGFVAEEEPDICPRCGGTFFTALAEEEMTASDWVNLGNQAVDEKRETDALAAYQRAAALNDPLGLTNHASWIWQRVNVLRETVLSSVESRLKMQSINWHLVKLMLSSMESLNSQFINVESEMVASLKSQSKKRHLLAQIEHISVLLRLHFSKSTLVNFVLRNDAL